MTNTQEIERVSNIVMGKLSNPEKEMLISRIDSMRKFRTGKISLAELDNILLFTGNKVKEGAYRMEEAMYKGETRRPQVFIRDLIEVKDTPLYNF